MPIRQIVTHPDPCLRTVSKPISRITPKTVALAADMLDTMTAANGVGLAAIQIGVAKRIIVIDETVSPGAPVLINPEIVSSGDARSAMVEGCLSMPDRSESITRPCWVTVRYQDLDGALLEIDATGLLAVVLQHEIDHLDGVLFVDHLPILDQRRFLGQNRDAHP